MTHDHLASGFLRSTMQNSPLFTAVVQLLTGKADALARCRSSAFLAPCDENRTKNLKEYVSEIISTFRL
jgi:hypothetical protein